MARSVPSERPGGTEMVRTLSAEDLLAGAQATHRIDVPAALLGADAPGSVTLKALTAGAVQRVAQAAKEERVLASVLMVQQALVEPKLAVDQVAAMSAGLLQFL